jgi:hypothetical protein
VYRVGVLFVGSKQGSVPDVAFRSGLRERGYIEGQNIVVEFRTASGQYNALPGLAAELVALNLDEGFSSAKWRPAANGLSFSNKRSPIYLASRFLSKLVESFSLMRQSRLLDLWASRSA